MNFYSNILPNDSIENLTQQFFESFDQEQQVVSEHDYAVIKSYFEKQTSNKITADLLCLAIFSAAASEGKTSRTVLEEFKKLSPGEMDAYVAYFLNISRFPSSFVGISNNQQRNSYVSRSIKF